MSKNLDHIPEKVRDIAIKIVNGQSFETDWLFYKYDASKPYSQLLLNFITDKESLSEVWRSMNDSECGHLLFLKVCEALIFWENHGKISRREKSDDFDLALKRLSELDKSLVKSNLTHFWFEHAFRSTLMDQVGYIDIENKCLLRSVVVGMKGYFSDLKEHLDFENDEGLPRKIKSDTAQRTYLAKELVSFMSLYFKKPRYGVVCKICNSIFTEPDFEYLTDDHVEKLCKKNNSKMED